MKGWICPRCDAVNGPDVKRCSCSPRRPGAKPPVVLRSSERIPTLPDPPGAPPRIVVHRAGRPYGVRSL